MSSLTITAVAAGGALGAVLRHLVNHYGAALWGTAFPWATLAVNVVGSLAMGLLIGLFAQIWNPPQALRAFLTIGLLGGLTTFSSFSLDVVVLYERQDYAQCTAYLAASVVLSIGALFAGLWLVRGLAP